VVQHGSLTFERRTERHLACFSDPGATPAEFEQRVTSVREQADVSRAETVQALEASLSDWSGAHEGNWSDEELSRARELASEKYESDAWTRHAEEPELRS